MNAKKLLARCPYKEGSASRRIFAALARAGADGLTAAQISRVSHVPAAKTATLVAAYVNPYHCSSLTRVGIALVNEENRYRLVERAPDLDAHRPPPKKKGNEK